MMMLGWRAYHADGRTWDSAEMDSYELPDGVIGVVEFLTPPYRKIVDGADWLWMEDGRWKASGTVWDGWVEKPHPQAVRGKAMLDDEWEKMQRRMFEDRSWP